MTIKQVDKYLGKYVAITFVKSWFNEATQDWVEENEEYLGTLNRCNNPKKHYQLDSDEWLPTDNACWREREIKSIREVPL